MAKFERLSALKHRDFRLYWSGQAVSAIGNEMQLIAVNWHIYSLLQDSLVEWSIFGRTFSLDGGALGLGALGLVRILPIMIFALLGGILADIVVRRKLLIWTDSIAAIFAVTLAAITLAGNGSVGWIYALTAAMSAMSAMSTPARQSLVTNLVPSEDLTNAISLNSLIFQVGTISGPAIAGILVAVFDIGVVYAINAATFGAIISMLLLLHHRGQPAQKDAKFDWDLALEGLRFTYRRKLLWSTVLLDFFATLFASARTMLPIIADQILGVGAAGYGILATAQPVGALIAGVFMSLRSKINREGVVLLVSVAIYGLATALFGLSTVFFVSYILFALTGAADTVSMVIRQTIRQLATPDRLRGRATSVSMIFFMGGPQLGELEAGLVAALFGVPFAVFTGGIATVLLTGWVAWKFPQVRNYSGKEAELTAESWS